MAQDKAGATGKPAILIIPGGMSPSWLYTDVAKRLSASGYETHLHNLRTYSKGAVGTPASLGEDAAFFHDKIEALVDEGKDVVVVAHSFGGLVATDAAHGLSKGERGAKAGGVVRIVYLSCIVGAVGSNSVETCVNNPSFDFMQPAGENGDFVTHIPERAAKMVFSDMPFDVALKAVGDMWPHSARSFSDKIQYASYLHSPVTYIVCLQDEVLVPSFQRERIQFIEKERGSKIDVVELDVGHCPNYSEPELTAKTIVDAIERNA